MTGVPVASPSPALQALLDLDVPECGCKRRKVRSFCLLVWPDTGCRQRAENGTCDCASWFEPCPCVYRAEDPFWDLEWECLFLRDRDGNLLPGQKPLTVAGAMEDGSDEAMLRVLLTWARKQRNVVADVADEDHYHGQPPVLLVKATNKKAPRWKKPMTQQRSRARVDTMMIRFQDNWHIWRAGDASPNGLPGVRIDYDDVRDNGEIMQSGLSLEDDARPELRPARKKRKMDESPEANVPWTAAVWDSSMRQMLYRVRQRLSAPTPSRIAI